MIFSNKIYKLKSGQILSLNAKSSSEMELYEFDKKLRKSKLILSNIITTIPEECNIGYKDIKFIGDDYYCICYDENMSVLENE